MFYGSMLLFDHCSTPFNQALVVVNEDGALLHVAFYKRAARLQARLEASRAVRSSKACDHVVQQLAEYFDGTRQSFDLRLSPTGHNHDLKVWRALADIPYGETASYLNLSRMLGSSMTPQQIGAANAANPIAIILPCHRVIGHDGKLVGYSGGLRMKQYLLDLERGASSALLGDELPRVGKEYPL